MIKTKNVDPTTIGSWQEVRGKTCSDRVQMAIDRTLCTPEIDLERALIEKEVLEETDNTGMERITVRAKIFERYLQKKKVYIRDQELIVGNVTAKRRASPISGELYTVFLDQEVGHPELDPQVRHHDKHIISDDERKVIRETIIPFFKGRTVEENMYKEVDDDIRQYGFNFTADCKHIPNMGDLLIRQDVGHLQSNYEKVLCIGLEGIRKEVVDALNATKSKYIHFERDRKITFYEAALTCIDAAIAHAERYAKEAEDLATAEKDEARKKELLHIAEVCRQVPAKPARNWQEALQSVWFIQMLIMCEQVNYGASLGRIDQYLLPYYKKSVEEDKEITKEEALELLEFFFVKFAEYVELYDYYTALVQTGYPMGQNMIIGGQTRDGKDAVNELSWLFLDAEEQVSLFQPELSVRIWDGISMEFLQRACEVVRLGRGKPKFYGDNTAIKELQKAYPELTLEDCRDYSVIGCVENAMPHITQANSFAGLNNMAKFVELALHDGKCSVCGKQIGPKTGDPRNFKSMDDLKNAVREQVFFWVPHLVKAVTKEMDTQAKFLTCPFGSVLLEGPIQKGRDVVEGGAWYTSYGIQLGGVASAADSLCAIDTLIYREKKVTWDKLLEALDANWEGYEDLRQLCVNGVPKYGNDDDYADSFGAFVMNTWYDAIDYVNTQKNLMPKAGGRFIGSILIGNGAVMFGGQTGALPDGRAYPLPLSDTLSPVQGRDLEGAAAVMRSVAKMPGERFEMGTALNQRISPQILVTDEDVEKFASYLKTAMDDGVYHVQFNVVTSEALRKAMDHPEDYTDLLVRVASYVAYFIELDKETQIDIIKRTEQLNW